MSHSKLSPSSAVRWLACPGSIRMSEGIPDTSSPAAEEGTRAHELGEIALRDDIITSMVPGDYPDEMREYIQGYCDYVTNHPGKLKIETRVDLGEWIPGGYGTADAIVKNGDTLHVIDLKYGMARVNAKDNSQMMLYALGSLKKKTKNVVMHIAQPRIDNWDTHKISARRLRAWGEHIKPKAALCLTDDAPLAPSGNACQWCPAAPTCPALHDHTLEVVGGDFDTLPAVGTLTPGQIATVLANKKLITAFLGKVEDRAVRMLQHGESLPGFKLVEAITRRKYAPGAESTIPLILGNAAYKPQELIPMGEAEKLIGKARFAELGVTVKPTGKPTVAPENDRRPAITPALEDFSAL